MNEEHPIPWEEIVEKANTCFRKTLEDAKQHDIRRKRVVSEAWFNKDGRTLGVLTNADRCFVMYMPAGCNEDSYIVTDPVTSEPDVGIWFELDNGQMDLHKKFHTTSSAIAFKVLEHFISTGEMASFVTWLEGNKIS
jgi:hypothetical protein